MRVRWSHYRYYQGRYWAVRIFPAARYVVANGMGDHWIARYRR